jgi:hypothetical protein
MDVRYIPCYALSSCDVRTWTALSSSQVILRLIYSTLQMSAFLLGKPKTFHIPHILQKKLRLTAAFTGAHVSLFLPRSVQPILPYFVNIHFNNILQSTSSLPSSPSLSFLPKTLIEPPPPPHTRAHLIPSCNDLDDLFRSFNKDLSVGLQSA